MPARHQPSPNIRARARTRENARSGANRTHATRPSLAFGRDLRLLDGEQFDAVFAQKQRAHGNYFSAHVAPNGLSHARIGFTVSKRRVSKHATARNRVKRIIRASFRTHQHQIIGVDYVIIAKPGIAEQPNPTLHAELKHLWKRAYKQCKVV